MNSKKKMSVAGLFLTAVFLSGCTYAEGGRWRRVGERTVTEEPDKKTTHEKDVEEREDSVKVDLKELGWLARILSKML